MLNRGCNTFKYTDINDQGVLYGMLYSGLIALGTATSNYPDNDYSPLLDSLNKVNEFGEQYTFGDAFVKKNVSFSSYLFEILIGAGSLTAQPYIPYGETLVQDSSLTITGTQTIDNAGMYYRLKDLNVTETGNATIHAKEIRIYPETDIKGYARFYVN
jgi:hypothetical protein